MADAPAGPLPGRHAALAVACASLFAFAVSATLLPAALLRAAPDFGIDATTLSWVAATQFAACFAATIYGGMLCDRYGKKPLLLAACLMLAGGAALWAASGSLPAAHLAGALMGMGGGILESQGSALLVDLYPERPGMVLNLSQVAYCAGAIAGPGVMALLLDTPWRLFFAAEAGLGLLLLISYLAVPMPRPLSAADAAPGAGLLRRRSVLLPALALFGYVLAESGIAIYANLQLHERFAAPERWAMLGLSLFWGGMLLGRLGCLYLSTVLSTARQAVLMALLGAAALGALALVDGWPAALALLAAAGLLTAGIWPAIVALAAAMNPGRTGGAVGVVVAIGSLGVASAPALAHLTGPVLLFPALAAILVLVVPLVAMANEGLHTKGK